MTPTNIITTTTNMSDTLAQVREATLRARKDFPGAKQVAEMDLALYRKVLGKVRAVLAVTPTPELWADVSALENIVKALEDFVAFMGKHMEEFGSAFSAKAAQKDDVALLAFLEEDYAKFVRARESMVAERAMVAELLRPQWVEAEMGLRLLGRWSRRKRRRSSRPRTGPRRGGWSVRPRSWRARRSEGVVRDWRLRAFGDDSFPGACASFARWGV
jgi:hypothetical protein